MTDSSEQLDAQLRRHPACASAAAHSLAVIGVVGYRVRQPARLLVQLVELRHQTHRNSSPHSRVHDGHLEGRTGVRQASLLAVIRCKPVAR